MILFHYRVQAFVNYHNRVSISDRIRVSITFDTQVFDHLCRLNSNISAVSEPTSQSASLLISQAVQSLTSTSSRPINQPTGSQVRLRVFMFHLFQKKLSILQQNFHFLKKNIPKMASERKSKTALDQGSNRTHMLYDFLVDFLCLYLEPA